MWLQVSGVGNWRKSQWCWKLKKNGAKSSKENAIRERRIRCCPLYRQTRTRAAEDALRCACCGRQTSNAPQTMIWAHTSETKSTSAVNEDFKWFTLPSPVIQLECYLIWFANRSKVSKPRKDRTNKWNHKSIPLSQSHFLFHTDLIKRLIDWETDKYAATDARGGGDTTQD